MAGNAVTLTFAGDSKSLEKTFDNVGKASKDMAGKLDTTGEKTKGLGKAFEAAGEVSDHQESKFMGLADTLDGLGATMGLPTEGVTALSRGFADLSGGLGKVIPLIGEVGATMLTSLGEFLPIIAGVALLGAGLVTLWKNSETFRDIVNAAFQAVKAVVGPIIDGIGGIIHSVVGWFHGSDPNTSADAAAKAMADSMKEQATISAQAWETWNGNVTAQLDDIINPLNRARENSKVSLKDIETNLSDNVAFYDGWINNLKELTSRGFGSLAGYFYSLGPTAEKAVGEAIHMTDPQLTALQNNVQNKLGDAGKHGADLLRGGILSTNFGEVGGTIGDNINNGLANALLQGGLGNLLGPVLGHDTGNILSGTRAAGGPVSAGSAYLVGENGPELFVPGMSGGIVPNGGGSGGGATIQLVLDGRVLTEVVYDGLLAKQRTSPLGIG